MTLFVTSRMASLPQKPQKYQYVGPDDLDLEDNMNIGVDEVGRGSVIGPLVVCAFVWILDTPRRIRSKRFKGRPKEVDELYEIPAKCLTKSSFVHLTESTIRPI